MESLKKTIAGIFSEISNLFKQKTNIKKNQIEYISALLYLKYGTENFFIKNYQNASNEDLAKIIDREIEDLTRKDHNRILFSNIRFSTINYRDESFLQKIIKIVEQLDALVEKENKKMPLLAGAFEEFLLTSVKKEEIIYSTACFYTPFSITEIMTHLLMDKQEEVFDPWCGSGNFLISAKKENERLHCYGLEENISIYNICMTNLFLHKISTNTIYFQKAEDLAQKRFDLILSNPPFSRKKEEHIKQEEYFSNPSALLQNTFADYTYVYTMLNHLEEKGQMAVILSLGALFRKNEIQIRKKLIEENLIDAIIGLPGNLFYSNHVAVVIMILKKNREHKDVLFIDAQKECKTEKNKNVISEKSQEKIVEVYKNREERQNFSCKVSLEDIRKNEYNLTIKRYVKKIKKINQIIEKQELVQEIKNLEKERNSIEEKIRKILG